MQSKYMGTRELYGKSYTIKTSRGLLSRFRLTRRWGKPLRYYISYPWVLWFFSLSSYLRVTDELFVPPRDPNHWAKYPAFHEIEEGTGIAIARSPRVTFWPVVFLDAVALVVFFWVIIASNFQGPWPLWLLALLVIESLALWAAYLGRLFNVFVVTPNAIIRHRGAWFFHAQDAVQSEDIRAINVRYPQPSWFWQAIGISLIEVLYGDPPNPSPNETSSTRRWWQSAVSDKGPVMVLRGIGNGDIVLQLLKGLQTSLEDSQKRNTRVTEQQLVVSERQLAVQEEILAVQKRNGELLTILVQHFVPGSLENNPAFGDTRPFPAVAFGPPPAPPDDTPTEPMGNTLSP
jgi:hypothetical protein